MSPAPCPLTAAEVLAREAPLLRSRLLDLAAALDRIDRADAPSSSSVRDLALRAIAELLAPGDADRTERVQRLYSRPYDPEWREGFAARRRAGGG